MNATLRQQLRGPSLLPEPVPIAAGEPVRCCSVRDGTRALTLLLRDQAAVSLPYAHFLYAELAEASVCLLWFATHRVVICGRGLTPLFEDAAAQRLDVLRELPRRVEPLVEGAWIERIEVLKHKAPATPLAVETVRAAAGEGSKLPGKTPSS